MAYKPGQSGNPGGRPKGAVNKATREIKAFCEEFLASEDYVESAKARVRKGKAPHLETLWHHYAYGKPKETMTLEGKLPPFEVVFKDDVSD